MSRNRNKKDRYRISTGGVPVTEVLLDIEHDDGDAETPDPTPALPQVQAPAPAAAALGKGAGLSGAAAPLAVDGEPVETADFHVFFPITKVDETLRQVWGRGAQETPDASGEILDWATSKPFIRAWSEDAFKRSGGKSKGNIRAMHQPIAAGRLLDLQLVDAEKAVDLGSEIVDDQEWRKVEKGVYTGYSIGGKYVKRWVDPANPSLMRYTARPTEFSLVDVPAIPTATFKLVKADGSEELRKFESVLAGDMSTDMLAKDLPAPATAPATSTLVDSKIATLPAQPGLFRVDPTDAPAGSVVAAQAVPGREDLTAFAAQAQSATPDTGLAAKASTSCGCGCADCVAGRHCSLASCGMGKLLEVGQRIGIARRADSPLTPAAGWPADWKKYADPANWAAPCDENERAEQTVAGYNAGAGKELYNIQEWAVLGRRIARLAGAVCKSQFKYDPAVKRVRRVLPKEANKMAAPTVMDLVGQARTLLASVPGSDAVDQALSIMDVIADTAGSGATAGTPSTVTPTPTTTGAAATLSSVETLAAAAAPASPSLPPNANGPVVANSTPGPSTTGDNSPSSPSSTDPKVPSTSVPTTPTAATKGVDTMAAPANTGEVFETNPPQAAQVFAMEGDGRIRAKLPEFMSALVNGGRKAIEKAFIVAEKDQQFFDELYNASLRKVLDDGQINYDNRAMLNKAEIFGTRGLGAGEEADLRKGVSSSFAPGIYLQRLVKLMLPIVTPMRNRLFTEQAPLGATTAQWRSQLGFTNFIYAAAMSVAEAGVTIGSTTGTGQTINESSLTFASPFASTPNSNVVSLQAIAAGRGYDDPLQIAVIQSLTAMLKTEECNLLYMSNASIAMTTVTGASAATGTLSAASYNVKVSALTGQGWRYTQDIPSYAGASTYSVGGVNFTTAGETAVTASGSFFCAANTKLTATWPSVKGAVAYNVYVSNGANEYWQQTVTVPSVTISALATTGSSGPAANTTANGNGYEGLVSWSELATIYGNAIPNKSWTDQAAAALTLAASNSIKEFDTVLKNLWVNWNIAPSLILCSPQGALHANATIASGSAGFSNYRIEATNVQGQIVGGLMQTGYTNKFANYTENMQRVVDIMAHPYMPDGTFLFLSEMINYRMARETRGFKVETRIPYTYFPLGPTAPHYPFTVLVDETLECFHPSGQAAIQGVNVS